MKVIVLCGGMGTRLREETEYRPKPMVEVGRKPIIWHIMRHYAFYGYRKFVLCLGYKGDMIKEYFLDFETNNSDFTVNIGKKKSLVYHQPYENEDLSVTLVNTGLETLTASRVKQAARYIGKDDLFMLTYGDGLGDVNIHALVQFHKAHGKLATVTAVRPLSRFGVLKLNSRGLVSDFTEKPVDDNWSSAGFMVLSKEVLNLISDKDDVMLERDTLETLVDMKQLMAYKHKGFFFPMDTYRDYLALNRMWESNHAPWMIWDPEKKGEGKIINPFF